MADFRIKSFAAALISVGLASFGSAAIAHSTVPGAKALLAVEEPQKNVADIVDVASAGVVFQLGNEGSEPIWMQMRNPLAWGGHQPAADDHYHVQLKLSEPKTKTCIAYAGSTCTAYNIDSGKSMTVPLQTMWGSSGLHYSANNPLLGDSVYAATMTVDAPTFQRESKDKDWWAKSVSTNFHFTLAYEKLTEVPKATSSNRGQPLSPTPTTSVKGI